MMKVNRFYASVELLECVNVICRRSFSTTAVEWHAFKAVSKQKLAAVLIIPYPTLLLCVSLSAFNVVTSLTTSLAVILFELTAKCELLTMGASYLLSCPTCLMDKPCRQHRTSNCSKKNNNNYKCRFGHLSEHLWPGFSVHTLWLCQMYMKQKVYILVL